MTKILNLDKLQTKKDKVIVLNGKEHVMTTFTVKDYISLMRDSKELDKLARDEDDLSSADAMLEITLRSISKAFPTIKREELEALSMDQLGLIRELAEDATSDDLEDEPNEGETQGKPE